MESFIERPYLLASAFIGEFQHQLIIHVAANPCWCPVDAVQVEPVHRARYGFDSGVLRVDPEVIGRKKTSQLSTS